MFKTIKDLFLAPLFYQIMGALVVLFLLAYLLPSLYPFAKVFGILFGMAVLVDFVLLFRTQKGIFARRDTPDKLSNGDQNSLSIYVENFYHFDIKVAIIDEIPFQFQIRDLNFKTKIEKRNTQLIQYELRPVKRGEYNFGALNLYVRSPLGLLRRRFQFSNDKTVPVYPSFLQMHQYELLAFSNRLRDAGLKKIRRIGQSMEFEQIREYVIGDDYRTINWKATARKGDLMVNQYQDEKAQNVYCLIDKGRVMKMPFEGLSLLDYSINATLVLLNIAIKKGDKGGLITFSHKMGNILRADNRGAQMRHIQELLYNQKSRYLESDYETLYVNIRKRINKRSLFLLFTNFESLNSLKRQLPFFKRIAHRHLLVVVFFENTELKSLLETQADSLEGIYNKVIAEKFSYEKKQIVKELNRHGIQAILSTPKNLTVNTLNKYLELKSRGMI